MLNLLETLKANAKPVFVHLPNDDTARQFLIDAENQGFIFSDGAKPTEKIPDLFFAVHPDMTINYIGAVGRIAYQCKAENIIRLDYCKNSGVK